MREAGVNSSSMEWPSQNASVPPIRTRNSLFIRTMCPSGSVIIIAAEFGVVMLIYLKHALAERCPDGRQPTLEELLDAIREGAVLRVRPKAMTVAVILAGLVPIVWSSGTGSEVMSRIAAPMLGGMVTAPLLSLFVIPAAYVLMRKPRRVKTEASGG